MAKLSSLLVLGLHSFWTPQAMAQIYYGGQPTYPRRVVVQSSAPSVQPALRWGQDRAQLKIAAARRALAVAEQKYREELNQLQNQLNDLNTAYYRLDRNDVQGRVNVSNARNRLQNQASRLRTTRSNEVNALRRTLNDLERASHWKYVGNLASVNGQSIPRYATRYRVFEGQLEWRPRVDPKIAARRRTEQKPAFDTLKNTAQENAAIRASEFEDKWLGWYQNTISEIEARQKKQQELISQISEPAVRSLAQSHYNTMASEIDETFANFYKTLQQELRRRQLFALENTNPVIDQMLQAGASLQEAKNELRYFESDETRQSQQFENSFRNRWESLQGDNNLKGRWQRFSMATFIESNEKRYVDFAETKKELQSTYDELLSQLDADYLSWVEPANQEFSAWKKTEKERLAREPEPHVRLAVDPALQTEIGLREKFFKEFESNRSAILLERSDSTLLASLDTKLEQLFREGRTGSSARKEVIQQWEQATREWALPYQRWQQQWVAEQSRRKNYPGAEALIALDKSKYPLRLQDANCDFAYVRELKGGTARIEFANGAEPVPLFTFEGKRSFACEGDEMVLIATTFTPLQVEGEPEWLNTIRKSNKLGWAVRVKGNAIIDVIEPEDEGLSFTKVVNANKNFSLLFNDPDRELVQEFCYRLDPNEPDYWIAQDVPSKLPQEVWIDELKLPSR